jgi:acyl-lipid omega-6 desaturase (Delta-12 desaturase)
MTTSGRSAEEVTLRQVLAPFAVPRRGRAVLDILTSVVPYLALIAAAALALRVSPIAAAALSLASAGFLIRTFIVFHDCAHSSFLPSKRANGLLGSALGVLVFTPFRLWRREHAIHHATAGDLDQRGVGDIHTLTVREYQALPWRSRLAYRLFRNPFVMFGLGPLWVMVIKPRFVPLTATRQAKRNVILTDLALVALVGGTCWALGWTGFLIVQMPALLLTGAAGIWLFYVQHQFEDTYWQRNEGWNYEEAALKGSSYLELPPILQFLTGNIGFHHVHHLNARIPNYNLQAAHEASPRLSTAPALTAADGLRAVRLKLWDESRGKLVTFAEARGLDR